METFGIVYLVTNCVDGKQYVGATIQSLKGRWLQHCNVAKRSEKGYLLAEAIREHGEQAFKTEVLCRAKTEVLYELERTLIEIHDTVHPKGYNVRTGGRRGGAYTSDSEWRTRRSNTMKAVWERSEHKAAALAYQQDPKKRKAWLEAVRVSMTEERKQRTSASVKAHFVNNPQAREEARQRTLEQFADPERRARHKAAYTPETRENIRVINKNLIWINNGVTRRKIQKDERIPEGWQRGMPHSAEHEAKRLAAVKAARTRKTRLQT